MIRLKVEGSSVQAGADSLLTWQEE
jgi:hypothetical protein